MTVGSWHIVGGGDREEVMAPGRWRLLAPPGALEGALCPLLLHQSSFKDAALRE